MALVADDRIAYCARQDGVANLWTVTADGAQTAQLSDNRDAAVRFASPIWSPAGDRVAYLTTMKANSEPETWSLWVTNRELSGPVWQTTAVLRLLGWLAPDRLLIAQAENVPGSRSLPTAVKLLSRALHHGCRKRPADGRRGLHDGRPRLPAGHQLH